MQIFWLDRDRAVARVRAAAKRMLAACPEIEQVVLFGSLAQGRAVPGSDADVLVITQSDEPWLLRNQRYLAFFDALGMPVDLFAYRGDEVPRAPVAARALATGTVIARRGD